MFFLIASFFHIIIWKKYLKITPPPLGHCQASQWNWFFRRVGRTQIMLSPLLSHKSWNACMCIILTVAWLFINYSLEARAAMGSGLCLSSIDTCTYIYIHTYLYVYNLGQINCTPCPPPSLPVGICSALGVTKIKPSCIQPESITIHPWKPRLYKNMPWETRE